MSRRASAGSGWRDAGIWVDGWFVEPDSNRLSRYAPTRPEKRQGKRQENRQEKQQETRRRKPSTEPKEVVRLEPKVMDVFVCLIERSGKTVAKDEFMERVWAGTVVTDDVLARCISELRKALGDDARNPSYIETIRKTGYRLIASVEVPRASRRAPTRPPTASLAPERRSSPERASAPTPERAAHLLRSHVRALADRVFSDASPLRRVAVGKPLAFAITVATFLVAAAAGGVWFLSPPSSPQPPHTAPFTSLPGEEFDPALSPQGDRVAYIWDGGQQGTLDVYVQHRNAQSPLRLTSDKARERSPAWSPDGTELAYIRSADGQYTIEVAPIFGSEVQTVANLGQRQIQNLVWSPNGSVLAFSAQDAPYSSYSIYLLDVDTGEQRQITDPPHYYEGDLELAFSPTGSRLAFTRSIVAEVQDVYVVSVPGRGSPRRLTHDHTEISGLDWTPNGESLVVASRRDGTNGLWRVPLSGDDPNWIAMTVDGDDIHQPSIARDGRMALTQRSRNTNIWRLRWMPSFGRYTSNQFILSTRWDSNPDIRPDGERIALASKRSGSFEIWTCDRSGSDMRRLTSFGGPFTSTPRWSPDGRRLAFVSRRAEHADIFVVGAQGDSLRRVTTASSEDVAPSWSQDGSRIYFASNREDGWQIWSVSVDPTAPGSDSLHADSLRTDSLRDSSLRDSSLRDSLRDGLPQGSSQLSGSQAEVSQAEGSRAGEATGQPTPVRITQDGGFGAFEGPDSQHLYYVKKDTSGIWQLPLSDAGLPRGPSTRLLAGLQPVDWGNWAVHERGIYYVRRTDEKALLVNYHFSSNRTTRVAYLDALPKHPSLAVSPNGDLVLHARVDRSESDILLVEGYSP